MKTFVKKYIPTSFLITAIMGGIALAVLLVAKENAAFADAVNDTVGYGYRRFMSWLFDKLPFSVAEIVIALIPIALIALVVLAVKIPKNGAARCRFLLRIIAFALLIWCGYVFALGAAYHTPTIDEKMQLERGDVDAESIYNTSLVLVDEINKTVEELDFSSGESVMPHDMRSLSEEIVKAYDSFAAEYSFIKNYPSTVKAVLQSNGMASSGLLGIYTYYTGEANVSVAYPDYCIPSTVAHEFAHQRGIVRENEANFMAFLVCTRTKDAYIRYSGYLNLLEHMISALAPTDTELVRDIYSRLDARVLDDLRAYSDFYNLHKDSTVKKIVRFLNDSFLRANGTGGVISYSRVVTLAVDYYRTQGLIQ